MNEYSETRCRMECKWEKIRLPVTQNTLRLQQLVQQGGTQRRVGLPGTAEEKRSQML